MQKINIKSSTLYRLSTLSTFTTDYLLRCIRLEIKDKKLFAITTNGTLGVIEYLGNVDNADNVCHIKLTEEIMTALELDSLADGVTSIEIIDELAVGKLSTMLNGSYNDFIWPDETPLNNWREWIELPTESKGFMYWDVYQIEMLFKTSPTGKIVFPEIINSTAPIILRDVGSDNWLGLFIPKPARDEDVIAATLPEWL